MKATGNTILITGGGTGIGLALAVRFLRQGILDEGRQRFAAGKGRALQDTQRRLTHSVPTVFNMEVGP